MQSIRKHFPSLVRQSGTHRQVFLDGPAGTQIPASVIDAMETYYHSSNANTHGHFTASHETDNMIARVRKKCAELLNASGPECISFGQNMTTLTFSLARAMNRIFSPGDEIVITQLDHEANRGPWLSLMESGIIVKEIALRPDGRLDYQHAADQITPKTKLVAAGWASNILGTVNDLLTLRRLATEAGAWLLVDAVHYAPHFLPDVEEIDCEFLLCSAYKFYGPHVGILYSRPGLLDTLPTDRLRTAGQGAPERIETGTLNHAALAGVGACIDFLADQGEGNTQRERLVSVYSRIGTHERSVALKLWEGLKGLDNCTLYGPEFDAEQRAPTISFAINGLHPAEICKRLAAHGINAWDGHFYALRTIEALDLVKSGGVTRMGIMMYNTEEEIERTISCLHSVTS